MLSLYPGYVDVVKTIKEMEEEKKKKHKHKSHNFICTTSDFTSYCANIICCTSTKQVWRVPIFLDG